MEAMTASMSSAAYEDEHTRRVEQAKADYTRRKLDEIFLGEPVPEGCHVQWNWGGVSYAGEGPYPSFYRVNVETGQFERGTVAHERVIENEIEKTVFSMEWEELP